MSLMEYISTQPLDSSGGAGKYHGAVAHGYDAKREQSPKWFLEQNIIEDMLSDLPKGSWVLDCPCGTGRFFGFYHKKGFIFRGIDRSVDMLRHAADKVIDPMTARLAEGDVRALPAPDKCVDASIMCRLTRWLSPADCQQAMRELQRVSRQKIIFTARVANHQHARTIDLFESALNGWKIARNEAGADIDYRVIELRPC